LQAKAGADGGGGDPVLAGAGLGDDALLAHAPRQQDLAKHVVDLVGTGVVQLVTLEVDLGAAEMVGQALGEIQGRGAAFPQIVHLVPERGVGLGLLVFGFEVEDQRHQRLGDETPAEIAEAALLIGAGAIAVRRGVVHRVDSPAFIGWILLSETWGSL
jgi:hypothetical protein